MALPLSIVVAVADNGVIGNDNQLIWRLKSDLKRFRALTWGKPIVMGRKTFQSIGQALPGRISIVLTRDVTFAREAEAAGVRVASSWEQAIALATAAAQELAASEIAVIGGAEIYNLALPQADTIYLTQVHATPEGDAVFPAFSKEAFKELYREAHPAGPDDEVAFTFIGLERKVFR